MRNAAMRCVVTGGVAVWVLVAANAQEPNRAKMELMKNTQVHAITTFAGAPDSFVPDNDPNTLQIVFMPKAQAAPSQVTPDGEVIFLNSGVTDAEQSALISTAFDNRLKR